jgi:hypothetical protein
MNYEELIKQNRNFWELIELNLLLLDLEESFEN